MADDTGTDWAATAKQLAHRATQNAIVRSYGIMPSSRPEDDELDRAAAVGLRRLARLDTAIGDPDDDWDRWPKARGRNAWKQEVRDRWMPWLQAIEPGATVCGNESAYWTRERTPNPLGGILWSSGFNQVSTIVLLRMHDDFRIAYPPAAVLGSGEQPERTER